MGGWRTWRLAVPIVAALLIAATCAVGGAAASEPAPTWAITAGPHRFGDSNLNSISCVTADDCVTVGLFGFDEPYQSMAQTWNGAMWSPSRAVNIGTQTWLSSVSCVTSTFCMTVGNDDVGNLAGSRALAESFDGTSWSRVHIPRLGRWLTGELESVSCVSTTWCMAIGGTYNSKTKASSPLVESWNGVGWQRVAMPPPTTLTGLAGVSCASPTFCVAVGSTEASATTILARIETWDGTTWSTSPSPSPGSQSSALHSVSCPTTTRCVAVGSDYYGPDATEQTLIETWDGTTWTAESTPTQGGAGINWLNGVSCADVTNCVAVGGYSKTAGTSKYRNLIVSWDGTDWSIMARPGHGRRLSNLSSVSCPGPTTCRAVGASIRKDGTEPPLHLTESPAAGV